MSSVAVKNAETASPGLLSRLHVGILAGVVYVVGSLAVLFKLLPWLWWEKFDLSRTAVNTSLLVLLGIAAAAGLVYLGLRLLGPRPTPGVKAGIFLALLSLLLVILLTRWASMWFEGWVYDSRALGETTGIVLTVAVGVVLLGLVVRFLFLPAGFAAKVVAFEEQGWFSTTSFKRSQGQRVRRGTMVGILALVGCGIYALEAHKTLARSASWSVNIPFTGKETVTALNDAALLYPESDPEGGLPPGADPATVREVRENALKKLEDQGGHLTVDLGTFRERNARLKADYVKLDEPVRYEKGGQPVSYDKGWVISNSQYDEARKELKKDPLSKSPDAGTGTATYATLTLLPDVRYTLPLLMGFLAIWVAWRIVNVPSFGDFLIATEAELNKVSWTTRPRLIQDTIVVLATVLVFTIFLFLVDIAWSGILSSRIIRVIQMPPEGQGGQRPEDKW
jgi:preprotein translocase SecE subunit